MVLGLFIEFLEGRTMEALLDEAESLKTHICPRASVRVLRNLFLALSDTHKNGVVHWSRFLTRRPLWKDAIALTSWGGENNAGVNVASMRKQQIAEGNLLPPLTVWPFDSPSLTADAEEGLVRLFKDCWSVVPEQRPTVTEAAARLDALLSYMNADTCTSFSSASASASSSSSFSASLLIMSHFLSMCRSLPPPEEDFTGSIEGQSPLSEYSGPVLDSGEGCYQQ
uniref:Protein kinase domain-containing protein n=1 Tax=Chromera velia CCMP2878 TaxID=1169474 RepID=A0A0G4HQG7_9ALVE|eukprot:Cvel_7935.t1-p1 / transcript=Cvel_7935.t1 / gene=Cvel_7935 / organism=Chromera_velia_CCMP2878 / gene_product=hypothetical protein / transcript_product=hypothetical protein / location=Cvel_scaffold426:4712-5926(+) / protein_length=224 / sequence_SO=supercontig / SO=protein_coding / is_pseudo=false